MNYIIEIGIIISAIGLFLLMITTRYTFNFFGFPYKTTNKPLAAIGWLLLIIGLSIIVVKAKLNGQLG